MAAQHGGFRKGAGRPKGSRNRATIAREGQQREALASARAANANLSAIDYLLQILRDPTVPRGLSPFSLGLPSLMTCEHGRPALGCLSPLFFFFVSFFILEQRLEHLH
jgi:hypothetical protein